MAYVCFNCGKGTIKGTQHRHKPGVAGRQHLRRAPRTPKSFVPNLHTAYLIEADYEKKVLLCTKCRRLLKKEGKIKVWAKPEEKKEVTKEVKTVKQAPTPAVSKKPTKKVERSKIPLSGTKTVKKEEAKPKVSVEDLVGKRS